MGETCSFRYTLGYDILTHTHNLAYNMLSRNHLSPMQQQSYYESLMNAHGEQRYRCQEPDCPTKTFILEYRYRAYEPGIKDQVIEMAINGSGIRDTGRVLKIDKNTVIKTLKNKANSLVQVNPRIFE